MKAKDAARIFNTLPDEVLVPVAQDMKSDILAGILANMNSDNAKSLTIKLANKLALPQTMDAIAPQAVAPTIPGPVTAALNSAATHALEAPAADQPAPVKKRVRKPRPATDTSASADPVATPPVAPVATANAPAAPAAPTAPASAAPRETPAQPKT